MRARTRGSKNLISNAGFTLIEIMVVIGIIVGVLVVGVPKMFNSSNGMREAIRKMAVMTRDIRNNSRLYGVTTRLVLTVSKDKPGSYSVESSPGTIALTTEAQEKEIERLTDSQSDDKKTKVEFAPEKRVLKSAISLPRGLLIEDVEKVGREKPVTDGKAYVCFFPQGLAEEAAIHFGDGKTLHWTMVINPLTGRADIYEKHITLKELKSL